MSKGAMDNNMHSLDMIIMTWIMFTLIVVQAALCLLIFLPIPLPLSLLIHLLITLIMAFFIRRPLRIIIATKGQKDIDKKYAK